MFTLLEMILPDYKGGCIVNLSSSILNSFGKKSTYPELRSLKGKDISKHKNVILLLIDGLGYDYIMNHDNGIFSECMIDKMTSVHPSTTASSITSLLTGKGPAQHSVTGWNMYLKEICAGFQILPSKPVSFCLDSNLENLSHIITAKGCFENLPMHIVMPKKLKNSPFNKTVSFSAKNSYHSSLLNMFNLTSKIVKANKRNKFIYTYWPGFDAASHSLGNEHKLVYLHYLEIQARFVQFLKKIQNTNSIVIVTSDHGFMDCKRIKFPKQLLSMLSIPPMGEPRYVYCYVKPDKVKDFKSYVNKKMKNYCKVYSAKSLVKKGCFGIGTPKSQFLDRIGDYVLILKPGYAFDPGVKMVGFHSGVSKEEMYTPLIVIHC
jgi:predicted AlkP superfamily pyrophosphatase or phosphodiesterase